MGTRRARRRDRGAVALDAWADWKTAYAEGYTLARQGKNWERVAVLMQEALKEKKDEGSWVNVTSGGSQPYLPYFYLGLARFNLGDCRGAVDNWRTSSSYQQFLQHRSQNEMFRDLFPSARRTSMPRRGWRTRGRAGSRSRS